MAFFQGLAPFVWRPSALSNSDRVPGKVIPGGQVNAGDWCQLRISWRNTIHPVVYVPGYFVAHLIYTPDSDDATPHEDMVTTYGGTVANRLRNYHIDPDVWFQVPFRGTLSIIAGGESDPDCEVEVLLNKGHAILDGEALMLKIQELRERALMGDPDALNGISGLNPAMSPSASRMYAPPIVGTPQYVPSTWIDVPANTPIPFPDGAQQVELVIQAGTVARLLGTFLGLVLPLDVAPGIRRSIGPLGQGFACSNGTPPTWQCTVNVSTLTVWSLLGG